MFEEVFATPLDLRMEDVARLYDLYYCAVDDPADLPHLLQRSLVADRTTLICARFRRTTSVRGHRACWAAVAEAVR